MKAKKELPAGKWVCLCAEISFDGRLLEPAGRPPDHAPAPVWWTRLLARRRSVPADPAQTRNLLDAGRVDELCLRVRPCVGGPPGQPTLSGPAGSAPFFARSLTWSLVRMATTAGGDCLLHYRRADP